MDPPLIYKLLTEMPQILKIEFQQRLIPAEVRNSKLDIYNQIIALASKLEEFSPKQREVLIPYDRLK
jgi:hypothetical protein